MSDASPTPDGVLRPIDLEELLEALRDGIDDAADALNSHGRHAGMSVSAAWLHKVLTNSLVRVEAYQVMNEGDGDD